MKTQSTEKLLRIFISEKDKHNSKPLYEEIILLAKKHGMTGASAIKGFIGFGVKSHIHTAKLLELSENLPIIIEIIDSEEKINSFLQVVDEVVKDGLVTLESVNTIRYLK